MSVQDFLLPVLVGAGGAQAIKSLTPKPPKPEPPLRMPDPMSPEAIDARRRKVAERQAASGRESTILTDDTYANNLLGE